MTFREEPGEHHEPEALRRGWSRPAPDVVPEPTYWPIVMGFGITFITWGLVTTYFISIVGLVLFGISLAGWIGDLLHEPHD